MRFSLKMWGSVSLAAAVAVPLLVAVPAQAATKYPVTKFLNVPPVPAKQQVTGTPANLRSEPGGSPTPASTINFKVAGKLTVSNALNKKDVTTTAFTAKETGGLDLKAGVKIPLVGQGEGTLRTSLEFGQGFTTAKEVGTTFTKGAEASFESSGSVTFAAMNRAHTGRDVKLIAFGNKYTFEQKTCEKNWRGKYVNCTTPQRGTIFVPEGITVRADFLGWTAAKVTNTMKATWAPEPFSDKAFANKPVCKGPGAYLKIDVHMIDNFLWMQCSNTKPGGTFSGGGTFILRDVQIDQKTLDIDSFTAHINHINLKGRFTVTRLAAEKNNGVRLSQMIQDASQGSMSVQDIGSFKVKASTS